MAVAIDIARQERRIRSKERRREVAVVRSIRDLEVKRRLERLEFEKRRARVLKRDDEEPSPVTIDTTAVGVDLASLSRMRSACRIELPECSRTVDPIAPDSGVCALAPVLEETSDCAERYRLLDGIRHLSLERTRACCRKRVNLEVQVRVDTSSVVIHGVMHCGNVHGCPVCAAAIYARRALELDSMIEQWIGYGPGRKGPSNARASMVTLTIRHGIGDSMQRTVDGVAEAWRDLFTGRNGQRLRGLLKMRHFARSLETTHGGNGWHPHLHCIVLHEGEWSGDVIDALRDAWADAVSRTIGSDAVPDREHGVTVRLLEESSDGRYVAKMGLEIAGIATKDGKNGNRTYWQIARDAAKGDRYSAALWRDAQTVLFGRRQLTWSRKTRETFELPDVTDEELAQVDSPDGVVEPFRLDVSASTWDSACRADRFFVSRFAARVLAAFRSGGDASGVLPLLRSNRGSSRSAGASELLMGCRGSATESSQNAFWSCMSLSRFTMV